MAALVGFMVLFGIILVFMVPVAFILSLVCLNKINQLERRLIAGLREKPSFPPAGVERPVPIREAAPTVKPAASTVETAASVETGMPPVSASPAKPPFAEVSDMAAMMEKYYEKKPASVPTPMPETKPSASLEQLIGTRWILIAGVVCVIAGVGYFLKYAYDNMWLGPWARVCVAAGGGAAALLIGEITRRRGYEIVAKGVTALGFAILYVAVFSAYRVYDLIGTVPAFSGAIVITIAAMAYAVVLDEVLAAFLALLGGFATPLIVSTGKNLPHHLFGYVLVLSCGAMACAMFRRWRAVNIMAFIGTFLLYTLWFEKFMRPILPYVQAHQDKILVAEAWLGVFFVIYLVLPLLYGFIKKVQAREEDIALPGAAGIVCFYYLWTMLAGFFRTELAVLTAVMGIVYLVTAGAAFVRCREDRNLRTILMVAGIAFITAALPLYFKTYALVIGWTIEAVILIAAGVIYTSPVIQVMGMLATMLSLAALCWIPSHGEKFTPVFNAWFGTWMFAAAGVFASHLFYRRRKEINGYRLLSEIFFVVAAVVALAACGLEWHAYCQTAFAGQDWGNIFNKGMLCILAGFGILLTAVGLFYVSILIRAVGIVVAAMSILGLFDVVSSAGIYQPIWNTQFGTWLAVGAGVGVNHLLYRFWKKQRIDEYRVLSELLFIATTAVIAAACCLEWYQYWSHPALSSGVEVDSLTLRGILVSAAAFIVVQALRPVSPGGKFCRTAAAIVGGIAGVIAVGAVEELYCRDFRFVLNTLFAAQAAPAAALFIAAILLRKEKQTDGISPKWHQGFALFGVILLWGILSQQVYLYWYCQNEYGATLMDWRFKANLCLSLLWAGYGAILLVVGFWKQIAVLRYLALGLFGLLLVKVFIVDMATVKSIYRISAFLATGLTLVGVSYLYQFLKKKGFFEAILSAQEKKQ